MFLNKSKYYLADLCEYKHEYSGTGQSLYSLKNKTCSFCSKGKKQITPLKSKPVCNEPIVEDYSNIPSIYKPKQYQSSQSKLPYFKHVKSQSYKICDTFELLPITINSPIPHVYTPKFSKEEQIEKFWNKVDKTDSCWLWKGFKTPYNYGSFYFQGKSWASHRLSYYLTYGEFDLKLFVCHKCDVRSCVNPEHLFLGTAKDNFYDMIAKNRHPMFKAIGT